MPDAPAAPGRFALLRIGSIGIVLEQREVLGVESRHDVRRGAGDGAERIEFGAEQCPVFALDATLAPITVAHAPGRVCAMLASAGAVFGVVCEELEIVQDAQLGQHPLPAAMRGPSTPVLGLIRTSSGLAVRSSARALAAHFGLQEAVE